MTNTPGLHGQDRKILQRHAHTRTAEQVFRTDWVNSLEITAGLPNCIYGPMIETAVPAQTSLSVRDSLRRRCGSGHQKKLRAVVQMKILAGGIDDGRRTWGLHQKRHDRGFCGSLQSRLQSQNHDTQDLRKIRYRLDRSPALRLLIVSSRLQAVLATSH